MCRSAKCHTKKSSTTGSGLVVLLFFVFVPFLLRIENAAHKCDELRHFPSDPFYPLKPRVDP